MRKNPFLDLLSEESDSCSSTTSWPTKSTSLEVLAELPEVPSVAQPVFDSEGWQIKKPKPRRAKQPLETSNCVPSAPASAVEDVQVDYSDDEFYYSKLCLNGRKASGARSKLSHSVTFQQSLDYKKVKRGKC